MANYVSQITPSTGGTYDIRELFPHIGNCTDAAATAAKTVTIGNFKLYTGAWVVVKFSNTNSAAVTSLTLNVDGTGAKPIKYRNANLSSAGLLIANRYTYFIYDGTNYQIVGDFDTNTTYSAGNHLALSGTTFKVADYCKTITDWNSATTNGWYIGSSVTNAPSTAWWFGRVIAHNNKYCMQEVWQFTTSTDGHKVPHKMRMFVNNVWGNWVDVTVGTQVPENAVFTDTKVTSSTNHYTPATASGEDISKSASGAAEAWDIDVVKGVTLNTDGKGHVTGLSVTSGKIPTNPVPSNNVTGSGTSGYLTKWNGTHTITNGPQLGSSTTTYLRNDGFWATPTDTKVNVTLATTSKAYLLGTTTTPTGTAAGVTSVADTGVYLTTTAGELCATKFMTSGKNGYYTHDSNNTKYPLVYDNSSNLWIGAESSVTYHHKGMTYISSGWTGTLPTTSGETLTGNSTIQSYCPK